MKNNKILGLYLSSKIMNVKAGEENNELQPENSFNIFGFH